MPGTAPRQRAAIALSFGAQAVLIAGLLALPGDLSPMASVSSSSAAPTSVQLLPIASPPDNWYTPEGAAIPVTVKLGMAGFTEMYPTPGVQSLFLLEPGSDVTVTVTLPASYSVPGLSFALCDPPSPPGSEPVSASPCRILLNVPDVPDQGTLAFTLHVGTVSAGSDKVIDMTVSREDDPSMQSGEIAEIVAS